MKKHAQKKVMLFVSNKRQNGLANPAQIFFVWPHRKKSFIFQNPQKKSMKEAKLQVQILDKPSVK